MAKLFYPLTHSAQQIRDYEQGYRIGHIRGWENKRMRIYSPSQNNMRPILEHALFRLGYMDGINAGRKARKEHDAESR